MQGGVEQLLEQGLALVGGGVEDFQKIPLGNHDRAGKLILGQPQQLIYPGVDLRNTLHQRAGVRAGHHGFGGLDGGALAAQLGPDILRAAPHQPGFAPVAEGQLHIGFCAGRRIVRAEGAAFPPLPAPGGLAVQGEADGVEQGGFACAGVPGNQEKAAVPQGRKVHRGFPREGAEGGQHQLHRLHGVSSSSVRMPRSTCMWASSGA